jgi:hypothetical protein
LNVAIEKTLSLVNPSLDVEGKESNSFQNSLILKSDFVKLEDNGVITSSRTCALPS